MGQTMRKYLKIYSWRVTDADVNTQCDYALLISDHSVFPQALCDEEFSVSVEIKPKCGYLPYILEEHTINTYMTRFKLHKTFKLKHKKVSQLSRYDPRKEY